MMPIANAASVGELAGLEVHQQQVDRPLKEGLELEDDWISGSDVDSDGV
jgi:hypothetical protein